MIKSHFFYITILFSFLLLLTGCTQVKQSEEIATISANKESPYLQTFSDLNLGTLFDFDFYLPNADKRWVDIWVESYENGKKNEHNLTDLSYGLNLKEIEEGHIGFGIINSDENKQQVFLYTPGVKSKPQNIESIPYSLTGWQYAIDETELEIGQTYLLAAYQQTSKDSIRTYNLQDEEDVKQMIKDDTRVYLLKIKIKAVNE